MNARRLITTILSTAALSAATIAGVAPAQAGLTQRIDEGTSSSRAPLMDDCSLRAPCSAIAAQSGDPAATVQEATRPVLDDCSLRHPCVASREANATQAAVDTPEQTVRVVVHRHTGLLR